LLPVPCLCYVCLTKLFCTYLVETYVRRRNEEAAEGSYKEKGDAAPQPLDKLTREGYA
jgi:hypothetical protein